MIEKAIIYPEIGKKYRYSLLIMIKYNNYKKNLDVPDLKI